MKNLEIGKSTLSETTGHEPGLDTTETTWSGRVVLSAKLVSAATPRAPWWTLPVSERREFILHKAQTLEKFSLRTIAKHLGVDYQNNKRAYSVLNDDIAYLYHYEELVIVSYGKPRTYRAASLPPLTAPEVKESKPASWTDRSLSARERDEAFRCEIVSTPNENLTFTKRSAV